MRFVFDKEVIQVCKCKRWKILIFGWTIFKHLLLAFYKFLYWVYNMYINKNLKLYWNQSSLNVSMKSINMMYVELHKMMITQFFCFHYKHRRYPRPPHPWGNPPTSSPLYSMVFVLPSQSKGCWCSSSMACLALNLKKSMSSAAASISAWITVLPWQTQRGDPSTHSHEIYINLELLTTS